MDRGRIKIIEFGEDGEAARAPLEQRRANPVSEGGPIKVMEFDHDPSQSRPAAPTPPQVRFIKIKEFDKDVAVADRRRDDQALAVPAAGAMKIVEFDKEPAGKAAEAPRRNGMKIVEFD